MPLEAPPPRLGVGSAALVALLASLAAAAPAATPEVASSPTSPQTHVTGLVLDISGAPVPGALVAFEGGSGEMATTRDGRFELEPASFPALLRVAAPGFATLTLAVSSPADLRLVIQPAPFTETVSVTASRDADVPSASPVSTFSAAELVGRAPVGIDDALRNTPGFSLFRRSSSRVANPTTQGVTLRGVSGSGASRTLVLADGLPLNDPFGSWVYWNRLPLLALERVEVVRGAGGELYGADALGGVIQLLTFDGGAPRLRLAADGGSRSGGRVSGYGSGSLGAWSADLAGEWARSGDFPVIAPEEQGAADTPAGEQHWSGFASLRREWTGWRARLRASAAGEDRENGTELQVNDTRWRQLSADVSGAMAGGALRVLGAVSDQTFRQSFSAVSSDRSSERLTTEQRVPADVVSGSVQWARPVGAHAVLVGLEGRRVGATLEQVRVSPAGERSPVPDSGGAERNAALLVRARLHAADSLAVVGAARVDAWRSRPRDGGEASRAWFLSPRLVLEWTPRRELTAFAAVSRAHRTPTLNELYRGFRVGDVITNANPLLQPERFTGVELGVSWGGERGSLRLTGFGNRVEDAIANVTLESGPELIQRERRNAGEVQARGLELEAELRPLHGLRVAAFAAFTAARFEETPALPDLDGRRVPQVPRWHAGVSLDWAAPGQASLSAQLRFTGEQFDDDLNQLGLGSFAVVDVAATRPLGGGLQAFASAENLLDAEYDVARTPVRSVGLPRTLRAGLRLFLH